MAVDVAGGQGRIGPILEPCIGRNPFGFTFPLRTAPVVVMDVAASWSPSGNVRGEAEDRPFDVPARLTATTRK